MYQPFSSPVLSVPTNQQSCTVCSNQSLVVYCLYHPISSLILSVPTNQKLCSVFNLLIFTFCLFQLVLQCLFQPISCLVLNYVHIINRYALYAVSTNHESNMSFLTNQKSSTVFFNLSILLNYMLQPIRSLALSVLINQQSCNVCFNKSVVFNQSEVSTGLFQPIRSQHWSVSTNQKSSTTCICLLLV